MSCCHFRPPLKAASLGRAFDGWSHYFFFAFFAVFFFAVFLVVFFATFFFAAFFLTITFSPLS
jgi:hypothetical protein